MNNSIPRRIIHIILFSILFILIHFIASELHAQTRWYVDKNATGLNDGSSWTNAYSSLSSISWSFMSPGDTIYISGGVDSVIYNEILNVGKSGSSGSPIVITKGLSSGHNGKVILDAYDSLSYNIVNNYYQYVNVENLYLRNATVSNYRLRNNNCLVKNVDFYISSGATAGIDLRGSNCIVEHNTARNSITLNDGQRDFMQITGGGTGASHIIRYNTFTSVNPDADDHCDGIQAYDYDGKLEIYGNVIHLANEKRSNSQGIYLEGVGGVMKIYNNVLTNNSDSTVNGMLTVIDQVGYDLDTVMIYGNSIYSAGFGYGITVKTSNAGTAGYTAIYNNAIRQDAKSKAIYNWNVGYLMRVNTAETPIINNNVTYQDDGSRTLTYIYNSVDKTFAQWQALGFDTNGYNEAPDWMSITEGSYDLTPTANGNLIDVGFTIPDNTFGTYYNADILGTVRPQGADFDIGSIEYSSISPDNTAPKLINALINNSNSVTLTFSEPLNSATAQNINNCIINNGVTVQSLVLSGSQIFLTTSDHSIGNYSITVNNVTDSAGNTIDPNFNSQNYQYTSVDTISPKLVSASVIDSITVDLYFSETLDPITSQNIANYTISDINISNALLRGNIITLSTSIHNAGTYSVFVNNVIDNDGNGIDLQHNSTTYKFQPDPNSSLLMFPVSNVNASVTPEPQHYAEKTIDGNGYYDGDPESRWTGDTMPEWLVYDLGDVQILNSIKLSFYKWNEGRIYNYSIQVSSDSINWTTVKSDVSSSLEEWTIEEVGSIDARYVKVIFVSCNQLNWASLWEAEFWGQLKEPENPDGDEEIPVTFNLEQNYPNPFNPSTRIKVNLPYSTKIKLTVYNMLGEFVSELADGEYEEGTYEFEFNALGLASGIYFYRIESSTFVESKKMVLLR